MAAGQAGNRPHPTSPAEWRLDNNERDTIGQPPLGDYTGIPFNEAGRVRADTTPESIWGTPEYQCRPHSAPHQWRGLGGARILKEQDPLTRDVSVYHIQFMRSLDRPIFMDGRPHPPAWAPHSWTGFSTGEWIGNTLKVTTTHLKDGYLKRGGPQTSDMFTMTEYLTRHDDILTIVTSWTIRSTWTSRTSTRRPTRYDPTAQRRRWRRATVVVRRERRDRSPSRPALPAGPEQRARRVVTGARPWMLRPEAAARGGVKTIYPEYRDA